MDRSEAGRLGYAKTAEQMVAERERKSLAAREKYAHENKRCPQCGQRITFEQRRHKFCSKSCSVQFNNPRRKARSSHCLNCGQPLKNKNNKYCGIRCQQDCQYKAYISEWLAGKVNGNLAGAMGVSDHVRRWLIEQRGEKCERCGWVERHPRTGKVPVQVDHMDGNAENTVPDNIRLLCPNCHSLTDNFGGLNRGRGRKARYKKK